jgi:predicted dehydrogenase
MRYATVGTSWITDSFIQAAKRVDDFDLTAVYSRDKARGVEFATKHGCGNVFDDLDMLAISDAIDAVYIASPNSLHYSQSKLFLENGKHVLCEKPIVADIREYEELRTLAKGNGRIYLEAIMIMHHPELDKVTQVLSEIGSITTARFDFSELSKFLESLSNGEPNNVFRPEFAAGCLMDLGIYCLYPAAIWFGLPKEIQLMAGYHKTGADSFINACFAYEDKQVNITSSQLGEGRIGSEIMGDKGTVIINYLPFLTGVWKIDKYGIRQKIIEDITRTELMACEIQDFYNYITFYSEHEEKYMADQEMTRNICEIMTKMRTMLKR